MNSLIVATALGLTVILTGTVTANAETFAVHGYQGTNYGGR